MSSTVTASQTYHVISIDSNKSESNPRGITGAFPIKFVEFPDVGSKVNLSNNTTHINPAFPLFTTYDLDHGASLEEAGANLVADLDKVLLELRTKQEPTKVTLIRLVNQTKEGAVNSKEYHPDQTIELDKASIHLVAGTRGTYQVQAEAATMGIGDKAGAKHPIDYKNKL
jgi:hypothetical protein